MGMLASQSRFSKLEQSSCTPSNLVVPFLTSVRRLSFLQRSGVFTVLKDQLQYMKGLQPMAFLKAKETPFLKEKRDSNHKFEFAQGH
jgi:hypothetical protein